MHLGIRKRKRRLSSIALNLTSMIDVTFLLLIYFMVTMVLTTPEDRLSSVLQAHTEPATGLVSDFQPQILDVGMYDGAPGYRLGSRVFRDSSSLVAALEQLNKTTGLFIRVSDEPTVEFVVAAFQSGHDAGFTKVTYVAPNAS